MPICTECDLVTRTGNYYQLRGWLCRDCLKEARNKDKKIERPILLERINENMNKTHWNIITNEKLTLKSKIKKLDKLFEKYCENLKKILETK